DPLERCAGDVPFRRAASETHDRAAGVLVPVRSAEPGERGHKIDAAGVAHAGRERFDFRRRAEKLEAVAQPLHDRTRDEDASLERTSGNIERGTPKIFSNSSSQSPVLISKSIVREALLTSVTCTVPPVRFQMSHESTVPNANSPAFALALAPFTFSRIHCTLVP